MHSIIQLLLKLKINKEPNAWFNLEHFHTELAPLKTNFIYTEA